eukprot:gene19484-14117_t
MAPDAPLCEGQVGMISQPFELHSNLRVVFVAVAAEEPFYVMMALDVFDALEPPGLREGDGLRLLVRRPFAFAAQSAEAPQPTEPWYLVDAAAQFERSAPPAGPPRGLRSGDEPFATTEIDVAAARVTRVSPLGYVDVADGARRLRVLATLSQPLFLSRLLAQAQRCCDDADARVSLRRLLPVPPLPPADGDGDAAVVVVAFTPPS